MHRLRRLAVPPAALAGVAALLAGCSGADSGAAIKPTRTSTPVTVSVASTTTAVTLPAAATVPTLPPTVLPATVVPSSAPPPADDAADDGGDDSTAPTGTARPATTRASSAGKTTGSTSPTTVPTALRTDYVDATGLVKGAVGAGALNVTLDAYAQRAATELRKALAAQKGWEKVAVSVSWTGTGQPAGILLVATGTGVPGVKDREYHLTVDKSTAGLTLRSAAVVDVCTAPRARATACR